VTSEIDLRAILTPVSNAVGYAKFYSRSHDAVIRVYDEVGNVVQTRERKGGSAYHVTGCGDSAPVSHA